MTLSRRSRAAMEMSPPPISHAFNCRQAGSEVAASAQANFLSWLIDNVATRAGDNKCGASRP